MLRSEQQGSCRIFSDHRGAAYKAAVNIIGKEADFEISAVTQGIGTTGYIQLFRQDEFYAPHVHIPAAVVVMGRNDQYFHPPLEFVSLIVHFRQDHGQGDPPVGAHIFDGHIQLQDSSEGIEQQIASIEFHVILAAFDGHIHGFRTGFRYLICAAVYLDFGGTEIHMIPFFVRIFDGIVDFQHSGTDAAVLHGENKLRSLALGNAQFRNLPLQSLLVQQRCRSLCGRRQGENPEAVRNGFVNDDVGRAGLGDIPGQIREEIFQFIITGRNGDIGRSRSRSPVLQGLLIDAPIAAEADDVDGGAPILGGSGCRAGRPAGSGNAVGKHDHNFCVI